MHANALIWIARRWATWAGEASSLLEPLVAMLRRYVLAANKVHGDDTPVPVLAPGQGKTKTGRLWTYVRDDRPAASKEAPAVWFAYSPGRRGEHPQHHLSEFRGTLQADAFAGFSQIYESGRVQEAACWAHVRRKFYGSDRSARGPLLESWHERLCALQQTLLPKNPMAEAVNYSLNQWKELTLFPDDGAVPIDNNASEREMKRVVPNRKNSLFVGNARGERTAAILSSFTATYRRHGIQRYLGLTRRPQQPSVHLEVRSAFAPRAGQQHSSTIRKTSGAWVDDRAHGRSTPGRHSKMNRLRQYLAQPPGERHLRPSALYRLSFRHGRN